MISTVVSLKIWSFSTATVIFSPSKWSIFHLLHDEGRPADVFYHYHRDTLVIALQMDVLPLILGVIFIFTLFLDLAWRESKVVAVDSPLKQVGAVPRFGLCRRLQQQQQQHLHKRMRRSMPRRRTITVVKHGRMHQQPVKRPVRVVKIGNVEMLLMPAVVK